MESRKKIRVLIADDHPIFRQGLRQVLESDPLIEVVAEAADGENALRRLTESSPDVAILDVDMPVMGGLDIARYVQAHKLAARLIFLSTYKEDDLVSAAMDLGVMGYVVKENAALEILSCTKAVAAGEYYFCPVLSSILIKRVARRRTDEPSAPSLACLTPTERTILRSIAENKTSKEIAAEMFISYRTVENHRTNICAKLNLHGSHKLLEFALSHKQRL